MIKKLFLCLAITGLAMIGTSCSSSSDSSVNANANTADTTATTTVGADNSDIVTTTDPNGVKTETRTFRNNPRVSKVVVTTRDGKRTVKVISPGGEERDVSDNGSENWMEATGDSIADAAGFVKDKSETIADKTKEGAKTAADKTKEGAQTAAEKTKEGAQTAADKTVDTTEKVVDETLKTGRTVGRKTKSGTKVITNTTREGVKKTTDTLKKIVNP
jgi:hypothetical protein